MSAHSESAASPAPCACTNISLMQLFHELKQKFPGVPDHVVSNTIELYCHDKHACETHLHSEAKASLTHAYHASSSAAARQLNEIKINTPFKCPNQPITKHEVQTPVSVKSITCEGPQTATLGLSTISIDKVDEEAKFNTDDNQNVVEAKNEVKINNNRNKNNNVLSPVINIDNCIPKYRAESPSDLELTNEDLTSTPHENVNTSKKLEEQQDSLNYRIHKSNKIKSNLNERLEKGKEKRTIKKEAQVSESEFPNLDKPKRPNTLEFLKPIPDIAFKESSQEHKPEPCKSISPSPGAQKPEPAKETTPGGSYWSGGYPLNLSVNVNCHMDYGRGFDPWLEEYSNPRAITSVNLTVCTPTSNMASPVRDDEGGFEGHVTVTVSPSTARPPRRRAPPPPQVNTPTLAEPGSHFTADTGTSAQEPSILARQRERLSRLTTELSKERSLVTQLSRDIQILRAPSPSPATVQSLRDYVQRLRQHCHTLDKALERGGNEPDCDFYSNIYTGQRVLPTRPTRAAPPPPEEAPPWTCHVCTFRNHPLLDKCEECDMPRILVVRSHDGITVRLVPGRRKLVRSWIL